MKYRLIASGFALGLALPVLAQDTPEPQQQAADSAKQQEGVHPPTNRLDKLVPPMKSPGTEDQGPGESTTYNANDATSDDSGASGAASGEPKSETIHPPTNRVDKAVPNMKSPGATDDLPSEQPATSQ